MRKIHQFLGLVLGVPLFIIGLSGSIYTWQPELTRWIYSDLYLAQSSALNLSYKEVAKHLENLSSKEIKTFYFPERERETYIIQYYNDEAFYFINPSDGKVLGQMMTRRGILDHILTIHMSFFIDGGKYFVAWTTLICAFMILSSGLYLWYPKRRKFRKRDFWNLVKSNSKGFNINWHKLIGLYCTPFILILALSGPYFTFKIPYQKIIGIVVQEKTDKPSQLTSIQSNKKPMNIEEALDFMKGYFTEYSPRSIHLNKTKTAYFSWLKNPEGVDSGIRIRPYMNVDIYTHQPIYTFDPDQTNTLDEITNQWIPPIHFGELGGFFHRLLNFLIGIGLCLIIGFGFAFYRQKKK